MMYTCQQDHCGKSGVDSSDFKKVEYRGVIRFAYVLCNDCAKPYLKEGTSND